MFSEQKTLLVQGEENQLIIEDAIEIKFDLDSTEKKREGTIKSRTPGTIQDDNIVIEEE